MKDVGGGNLITQISPKHRSGELTLSSHRRKRRFPLMANPWQNICIEDNFGSGRNTCNRVEEFHHGHGRMEPPSLS